MSGVTVTAESSDTSVFGHTVSTLQTGVTVSNGAITGTLKYCNTGALKRDWGAGNFLVLKFSDLTGLTSVKVGLMPSASGMELQEIMTDPDKNGVFKITDKDNQVFVVDSTDGTHHLRQTFTLSGLTLQSS